MRHSAIGLCGLVRGRNNNKMERLHPRHTEATPQVATRAPSEPGDLGALRRREHHHPLRSDGLRRSVPGSVRDELQRLGCEKLRDLIKRAAGRRLRLLPGPAPAGRQLAGLRGRLPEPAVEGLVVSLVAKREDAPPAVRRKPLRSKHTRRQSSAAIMARGGLAALPVQVRLGGAGREGI